MWIRVETNVADNDKIHCFANFLGISVEEALGFLVRTWGKVAEHRIDGDLEGVLDSTIESWASWRGSPGMYAEAFKEHFVNGCQITGWKDRQGKLIARQAKDRDRKRPGNSTEIPRNNSGISVPTKRNDTKRSKDTTEVSSVVEHYLAVHPRRRVVDAAGRRKIAARLNDGFTVDDLKQAINGQASDPWCIDKNKMGVVWSLRDADNVQEYMEKAERSSKQQSANDDLPLLNARDK